MSHLSGIGATVVMAIGGGVLWLGAGLVRVASALMRVGGRMQARAVEIRAGRRFE